MGETPLFIYFLIPITFIYTVIHTFIDVGRKVSFLKTYNDTHFATFRVKFAAPCVHRVHTLTFIQYSFILGIAETTLVVHLYTDYA